MLSPCKSTVKPVLRGSPAGCWLLVAACLQVAQFSSSAASNPQLYALKLSQERKQQMEELHHNEPMRWEDIV